MMPWFVWKNKNSYSDFGLWISKLPSKKLPEERYKEVVIPGRAGSMILLEGEDVFSSYLDEITVIARNTLNIHKIIEWLRGSSELIVSNDAGKARIARISGEVSFARVGNSYQQAVIPFICQPFKKSIHAIADRITVSGSSATIVNPGDIPSKPIVSITGSGNNTITIGDMAVTLSNISGTVVVDCGARMTTKDGVLWTESITGDLWEIPKGEVAVTQTGSMTIQIDPEWRWL